tara:strand:- start:2280 stop:4340 length:2061 start_codon:yes stop_codon:yes gene_type:complete
LKINNNKYPAPKKIPFTLQKFDSERVDNYYWLNQRDDDKVIEHLKKENNYYLKKTRQTKNFQKKVFKEIKAKIKEDDESVPYLYNTYWYQTKFEKSKQYPKYYRTKNFVKSKKELILDCNKLAKGHKFFDLSNFKISHCNNYMAFATDYLSRRLYTIQIKNLNTSSLLKEKIENCSGSIAWTNDSSAFLYSVRDPKTLRSNKIFKHVLGTNSSQDELIFHEKDPTFITSVTKSKSNKFLIISSSSTLTTEYRFLDANKKSGAFKLFSKRKRGLEYTINHYDDYFFIITNKDDSPNYKLMKTSTKKTNIQFWKDVIPHRKNVLLEGIDIFKNFLVVSERINGLSKINVIKWENNESFNLKISSETYSINTVANIEFNTDILRYNFSSFNQPNQIIDFNMKTKRKTILKEQEVLDMSFDCKNYVSKRLWADAEDGESIPISIVYKKGKINNKKPLLLYGYGSYGHIVDPYFSVARLSLLDRGFAFAIAHVRGSEYLGRSWYENGKLLHKKNTFNDFISCAKYLISNNYTNKKSLYGYGGSAGGLLIGAVINISPKLFNGLIAAVPFVDVVTTMLDETIPLTTGEYDEWGNPNKKEYYDYILSYSPYDNIKKMNCPNILVTTGFHDSQVQYWEPAKWVAKLREFNSGKNDILFKIDMKSGHGGASGRYDAIKDVAAEYCFLFDLEKIYK